MLAGRSLKRCHKIFLRTLFRYFLTIVLPLAAGIAIWFYFLQIPNLSRCEEWLFWYPERHAEDYFFVEPSEEAISVSRVTPEPERLMSCQFVLDEEAQQTFRANPLTASNWVFILNRLRAAGSDTLMVAQPLSWQNADELSLRALEHQLSTFRHSVLAVDLTLLPEASPFPSYLENSTLTVKGDLSQLPEVNNLLTPPSLNVSSFGFGKLPFKGTGIPLLARWGDRVIPSIELALLISKNSGEVEIELGRQINCGVILPIDKRGVYELPLLTSPKEFSLGTLLTSEEKFPSTTFIRGGADSRFRDLSSSFAHMATRRPGDTVDYHRLDWRRGAACLVIFVLLLQFRGWLFLLPIAALCAMPPLLSNHLQIWLPLSPFLAALLIFLLVSIRSKNRKKQATENV